MSFLYNKYLFQCDYLYKHNINHLSQLPVLESLSTIFDLGRFKSDLGEFLKSSSDSDLNLIGFFVSYLNINSKPFIYFSNAKSLQYALKQVYTRVFADRFLYTYFLDFYCFFFSSLLFNPQKTKNFYSFKSFLTNSLFLKYYLREIFNVSSLKKIKLLFNITLG